MDLTFKDFLSGMATEGKALTSPGCQPTNRVCSVLEGKLAVLGLLRDVGGPYLMGDFKDFPQTF